jgi:hypothetical protein
MCGGRGERRRLFHVKPEERDMDVVSMGVGAAVLGVGFCGGVFTHWWFSGEPVEEGPPRPKCGCTHGLQTHDPGTGTCTAGVKMEKFNEHGTPTGYQWGVCSCKRYVGPLPEPDMHDLKP